MLLLQEEHLYKAFQVLDSDGSGFIDKQELIKALGEQGNVSDLDEILKQVRARVCARATHVVLGAHATEPLLQRCVSVVCRRWTRTTTGRLTGACATHALTGSRDASAPTPPPTLTLFVCHLAARAGRSSAS